MLKVYNNYISIYVANAELNHVSESKERDTCEVNEALGAFCATIFFVLLSFMFCFLIKITCKLH